MKVLKLERLGMFVELINSTINIIEKDKTVTLDFVNSDLAEFWFNSLVTQIESLADFTVQPLSGAFYFKKIQYIIDLHVNNVYYNKCSKEVR